MIFMRWEPFSAYLGSQILYVVRFPVEASLFYLPVAGVLNFVTYSRNGEKRAISALLLRSFQQPLTLGATSQLSFILSIYEGFQCLKSVRKLYITNLGTSNLTNYAYRTKYWTILSTLSGHRG